MKEYEVKGLLELKSEYESKLENLKEYQDIRNDFQKKSLELIKESLHSKGIKPEVAQTTALAKGGCGACTTCITSCISCVFHVAGDKAQLE